MSVQDDSKGHPIPEFPLGAAESSGGPTWQVHYFRPRAASPASLELHLQRVTLGNPSACTFPLQCLFPGNLTSNNAEEEEEGNNDGSPNRTVGVRDETAHVHGAPSWHCPIHVALI